MLVVQRRWVAVDVAEEGLLAVVDHLHGAFRLEGEHAGVDLHAEVLATAERAADAGECEPHLIRRKSQALCYLILVYVQPLGRDVKIHAAFTIRDGHPRFGTQESLVLHPDPVISTHHHVGGRIGVAALYADVPQQVTGEVQLRRALTHRLLGIHDRL